MIGQSTIGKDLNGGKRKENMEIGRIKMLMAMPMLPNKNCE